MPRGVRLISLAADLLLAACLPFVALLLAQAALFAIMVLTTGRWSDAGLAGVMLVGAVVGARLFVRGFHTGRRLPFLGILLAAGAAPLAMIIAVAALAVVGRAAPNVLETAPGFASLVPWLTGPAASFAVLKALLSWLPRIQATSGDDAPATAA